MRELLLLRHAKSRWDEPDRHDAERGLSPRGEKAASRIGAMLAQSGTRIDRIICSTAQRTIATLEIVAARLEERPPVRLMRSLYLASPAQIMGAIQRQAASVRTLMVIGHNPGMHGLAMRLAGHGDVASLEEKFPTGALAHFRFAADLWCDVAPGHGVLVSFVLPRELR
jgi:phosphohistidine phosphatase